MTSSPPGPAMRLHLRLWVRGRARTKGSMRVKGRRANGSAILEEAVEGSKRWRQAVAHAALTARGATPGPGGWVGGVAALQEPVSVRVALWLPRPTSGRGAASVYPDVVGRDDLDKLQRNIGDALTDAGVLDDDGRIVHWDAWKLWAPDPWHVGALIEVRGLGMVGA